MKGFFYAYTRTGRMVYHCRFWDEASRKEAEGKAKSAAFNHNGYIKEVVSVEEFA